MKRFTPLLLSAALLVSGAAFAADSEIPMPNNCQDYVVHQDVTAALLGGKNVGQVKAIASSPNCSVHYDGGKVDTLTFTANGKKLQCVNVRASGVIGADCYSS